jgi:dGTPase
LRKYRLKYLLHFLITQQLPLDLGLKQTRTGKTVSFSRHPLTFLVEAADDICYTIIDFEDGINLGLIEEEKALEFLMKLVRTSIDTKKYTQLATTKSRVSYLRALAISAYRFTSSGLL